MKDLGTVSIPPPQRSLRRLQLVENSIDGTFAPSLYTRPTLAARKSLPRTGDNIGSMSLLYPWHFATRLSIAISVAEASDNVPEASSDVVSKDRSLFAISQRSGQWLLPATAS